ncbi:DNA-binding transcriptional regulator, FrmR family [Marinitoga hydrogenitolerans DSM 16785]|uniref:Copper-sensing transcriptional repressor CsoR n=1 Tax=Marinitoga hydrogenitolerans (strain DSM 16785 / JCM 12826 / AT1271) TaxID=1122195 RepID=A0A1M4YHH8_MARH1|nr:metal-sensing transcriptional repressor [Marinitoga hydrogenitolerans]SHF05179.1 DNA-binding transcriptional regulator, FrmR family [Marinitoga hydrogenitolerans DSM 16785]
MHKNKKGLNILKTAKGQVEAVVKMLEDDRYCIDVSKQILASISLLKKANAQILNTHLESCVKDAVKSKNAYEVNEKILELEEIMCYINKTL